MHRYGAHGMRWDNWDCPTLPCGLSSPKTSFPAGVKVGLCLCEPDLHPGGTQVGAERFVLALGITQRAAWKAGTVVSGLLVRRVMTG